MSKISLISVKQEVDCVDGFPAYSSVPGSHALKGVSERGQDMTRCLRSQNSLKRKYAKRQRRAFSVL